MKFPQSKRSLGTLLATAGRPKAHSTRVCSQEMLPNEAQVPRHARHATQGIRIKHNQTSNAVPSRFVLVEVD